MVLYFDKTSKYGHKGFYLLLSKKKPHKVLYIFGTKKPLKSQFLKQEKRIQFFKHKGPVKVQSYLRKTPRRRKI